LETAITLWFNNGDPVAIHTLTDAAYGILYALNIGGAPMLRDSELVKPEFAEKWHALHSDPGNFVKHASKDPNEIFHLAPEFTDVMLLEAVGKYQELSNAGRPLLRSFHLYMAINSPRLFLPHFLELVRKSVSVDDLAPLSRQEFFHALNLAGAFKVT
jgi:hypothetical protein